MFILLCQHLSCSGLFWHQYGITQLLHQPYCVVHSQQKVQKMFQGKICCHTHFFCFSSCSYVGHYSIVDKAGGGENGVILIGWAIICVIEDIRSHVCKMARPEQAITRGGNKWKWSGKTSSEKKREKKTDTLATYQTVCHWIRVMCFEEEENIASRQFSRVNILKAFIVLQAEKDI